MTNGLVCKCRLNTGQPNRLNTGQPNHLNTGQPNHLNTGQIATILFCYVLFQYLNGQSSI